MKIALIIFLLSQPFFSQSLNAIDIKKFNGLWYEIARTYNYFEKECVASTIEYKLTKEQTYRVFNRCFKETIGGECIEYKGFAKIEKKSKKIDMTYYYFFTRSYDITEIDSSYHYAVIADKNMDSVWIMSRTPILSEKKLAPILSRLKQKMDIKKLIFTPQDPQGVYK